MKRYRIKDTALALGIMSVLVSGCSKKIDEFGGMNNNPNATTVPITSALLTNTLAGIGGTAWGDGINTLGGLYCQYLAETQYTDISRYATPTINWDGYYAGVLYDLQNIINTCANPDTKDKAATYGSLANQTAIARILKVYYYAMLTDAFGDLPYTEALQGKGTIPYDKQESVYPALINELKAAAGQFDAGTTVQGDLMFAGNTTKWRKFANSLRAIMALRMSKSNEGLGKTEFAAAVAGGVIDANADNATITYPGGNYRNPIYNYYVVTQRFDYAVSESVTNLLNNYADPRISRYGSNAKGFPYGLTRNAALAWQTANPSFAFLYSFTATPQTFPMSVLTAGQVFLARAEAARRGWTTESAATMYANGITAEMNRWGITTASAISAYIAAPNVALDGTAGDFKKIAEQTWIAHYPNGNQGWAEWRRTGFPALTPAPGQSKPIPRRIPYGPNEPLYNPTNYQAAAALYNNNSQDARVWWDK